MYGLEELEELFDPDRFEQEMGPDADGFLVEHVVVEPGEHHRDDIR